MIAMGAATAASCVHVCVVRAVGGVSRSDGEPKGFEFKHNYFRTCTCTNVMKDHEFS